MPNDTCGTAINISSLLPYTTTINTTAFADPSESPFCLFTSPKKGAWFLVSNAGSDPIGIVVNTAGSDYYTNLSIWSGSCGSLVEEFCGENFISFSDDFWNEISFTLPDGESRYILVLDDDSGSGGSLTFNARSYTVDDVGVNSLARMVDDTDNWNYGGILVHDRTDGAITVQHVGSDDEDPSTTNNGGTLAVRRSDGHLFRVRSGKVIEYDNLIGVVEEWGETSTNSLIFPSDGAGPDAFDWSENAALFVDDILYIGWYGGASNAHWICTRSHDPGNNMALVAETSFQATLGGGGSFAKVQAFSPDGTAVYFFCEAGATNEHQVIKKVLGGAESVFASNGAWDSGTGTGNTVQNITTDINGNVYAVWHDFVGGMSQNTATLKGFDSLGNLIGTVNLTGDGFGLGHSKLAADPDGSGVWLTYSADLTHYNRYLTSDMSLDTSFTVEAESGNNQVYNGFVVLSSDSGGDTFEFSCDITIVAPAPIPSAGTQQWRLHRFDAKIRGEQSS